MAKKLDEAAVFSELREGSAFFRDARRATEKDEVSSTPPPRKPKVNIPVTDLQTHRVTESVSTEVTDSQSHRLTDFSDYEVPDYRELKRTELRLTWDQDDYLGQLESKITRDMPEGDRSDPKYKRVTKNSIIRALVEYARRLNIRVDASRFRNEADLAKAIAEGIEAKLKDLQSNRVTESVSDRATD